MKTADRRITFFQEKKNFYFTILISIYRRKDMQTSRDDYLIPKSTCNVHVHRKGRAKENLFFVCLEIPLSIHYITLFLHTIFRPLIKKHPFSFEFKYEDLNFFEVLFGLCKVFVKNLGEFLTLF